MQSFDWPGLKVQLSLIMSSAIKLSDSFWWLIISVLLLIFWIFILISIPHIVSMRLVCWLCWSLLLFEKLQSIGDLWTRPTLRCRVDSETPNSSRAMTHPSMQFKMIVLLLETHIDIIFEGFIGVLVANRATMYTATEIKLRRDSTAVHGALTSLIGIYVSWFIHVGFRSVA